MKLHPAAAAALALAICLPVSAGAAPRKPKKTYDPDELICVTRNVTGSRLQRIRQCHTAAEWEEVRMQERVGLSRKQHNGASEGAVTVRDTPW